jgi:hypothetical protein
MELIDLPRDVNASLTSIRRPLVQLVNSCRRSAPRRELLKATLEAALEELNAQGTDTLVEAKSTPKPATGKPKATKRATAKVDKDAL